MALEGAGPRPRRESELGSGSSWLSLSQTVEREVGAGLSRPFGLSLPRPRHPG